MEEHKLVIVEWINSFLKWLFSLLGIGFHPAKDILPTHVVMAVIVTAIIIVFFKLTVKNLSLFPQKMQNVLEMY
jgi:F0F1-type ATP synthase membrane subunit a